MSPQLRKSRSGTFCQVKEALGVTGGGKVQKVQNVLDCVREKCPQNFVPDCAIAIDETTIAFKGRLSCKMYTLQKPTKWRPRVYVLADYATGYICTFEPYYGRETTALPIRPDLPFTTRIVVHLVDRLMTKSSGSGYHLYTDRLVVHKLHFS